jgi:uncharacterized protein (DUF488 family)
MKEVMTIGYERADPERFLRALKESRVDLLVDVRMVPFSHKPGFTGAPLRQAMEAAGIGYLHLQDLGNPKEGRDAAKAGDVAAFHRIYRTQMASTAAQRAISRIVDLSSTHRPCMMCFERSHRDCHRGIVAEAIEAAGLGVIHLEPEVRDLPLRRPPNSAQGRLL